LGAATSAFVREGILHQWRGRQHDGGAQAVARIPFSCSAPSQASSTSLLEYEAEAVTRHRPIEATLQMSIAWSTDTSGAISMSDDRVARTGVLFVRADAVFGSAECPRMPRHSPTVGASDDPAVGSGLLMGAVFERSDALVQPE
jgi:hypothetical protein